MPDLDTELAALGDRLRGSITPPDLSAVADRARERTVRRRTQLAAIVVVLVVSAAVPLLRALPGPPAAAPPTPTRPPTYSVEFADADHAFAVDRQCERTDTCRLLSTDDGGSTWTSHDLPPGEPGAAIVGLFALGPERVAVDRLAPGPGGDERIYSDDAGRTWATVESEPRPDPIGSIPDGAVLGDGCAGAPGAVSCGHLVVTMPDSGETRALENQPQPDQLLVPTAGPVPTADGTWWASGVDGGTTLLSVSTDSGRTWRTSALDVPLGRPANTVTVVEGDGVLYAVVAGSPDRSLDLLGIFRSDDGGATWTRTYRPVEGRRVPGFVGTPIVTATGLIVITAAGTFDGQTLAPNEDELAGFVRWTRAGYVSDLPSADNEFAVSTDGTDWRRFTVG